MADQGLIHIYYGDGKGKTSAALGLGIRAAGRGRQIVLARFLKDGDSGELEILRQIRQFQILAAPDQVKFTWKMSPYEKAEYSRFACKMLENAIESCRHGACDVLILDEVFDAVNAGIIPGELLLGFLREKPQNTEIVMTGHLPSKELLGLADYISHISCERHPYESGVPARYGIEY